MMSTTSLAFVAPTPLHHHQKHQRKTFKTSFQSPVATAQLPRTTQATPSPSTKRIKNASKTSRNPPSKSPLPYFAYFSNMNPSTLGPCSRYRARRVQPQSSKPARLPRFSLKFDVPGFPPEPLFANLRSDSLNEHGVHGVLHWISADEFSSVAKSEGVLPFPFPDFAQVRHVTCILTDGTEVKARTLVFQTPPFSQLVTTALRPSRRYVQSAIHGAEFHGVESSYIDKVLRQIKTDNGPLGGFGLLTEPRPHLLDRPNPNERFRRPVDEIYSPYTRIPAHVEPAVDKLRESEEKVALHLIRLSSKPRAAYKKKLYYIPGIDGNGKGIVRQIDSIEKEGIYDVSGIVYPPHNRQSVPELASEILHLIEKDAGTEPVCIYGESMGGVLSIVCVCENEERSQQQLPSLNLELVMVLNPASSYPRSATRNLWDTLLSIGLSEDAYKRMLPFALLPLLIDFESLDSNVALEIIPRLRKMLAALGSVADILPSHAVRWRISLLKDFNLTNKQYRILSNPGNGTKMAVIAAMNDNLLPSFSELKRLERRIPGIYTMVLPYGGHAAGMDARFNLAAFLGAFNVDKSSQKRSPSKATEQVLRRREAFRKRFLSRGSEQKLKLSRQDLRFAREYVQTSVREFSPVFIGEENIPEYDPKRPVLFVGNHTLLGWLDTAHPVYRVLQSRGVLIRALAHPILLQQSSQSFPMMPKMDSEQLKKLGVTQIGPNSLVEQLCHGNWMLMFPGGATEALKDPRGRKYELFWPRDPEFVRSCALFGAQIVPLSTVGTEDSYIPFLSSSQLKTMIDGGSRLMGQPMDWSFAADSVRSWKGDDEELRPMVPPLPIPTEADRTYYRFGKALHVPEECVTDREMERRVYEQAREAVREGIEILLRRREADEYRRRGKRREFAQEYGEEADAPCGQAWLWKRDGGYLDEDLQP
ncbi:unnamed protein product [Agarophyton chilense]